MRYRVKYIEKSGYPKFGFTTDEIDWDSIGRMHSNYFFVTIYDMIMKSIVFIGGSAGELLQLR